MKHCCRGLGTIWKVSRGGDILWRRDHFAAWDDSDDRAVVERNLRFGFPPTEAYNKASYTIDCDDAGNVLVGSNHSRPIRFNPDDEQPVAYTVRRYAPNGGLRWSWAAEPVGLILPTPGLPTPTMRVPGVGVRDVRISTSLGGYVFYQPGTYDPVHMSLLDARGRAQWLRQCYGGPQVVGPSRPRFYMTRAPGGVQANEWIAAMSLDGQELATAASVATIYATNTSGMLFGVRPGIRGTPPNVPPSHDEYPTDTIRRLELIGTEEGSEASASGGNTLWTWRFAFQPRSAPPTTVTPPPQVLRGPFVASDEYVGAFSGGAYVLFHAADGTVAARGDVGVVPTIDGEVIPATTDGLGWALAGQAMYDEQSGLPTWRPRGVTVNGMAIDGDENTYFATTRGILTIDRVPAL